MRGLGSRELVDVVDVGRRGGCTDKRGADRGGSEDGEGDDGAAHVDTTAKRQTDD